MVDNGKRKRPQGQTKSYEHPDALLKQKSSPTLQGKRTSPDLKKKQKGINHKNGKGKKTPGPG